MKPYKWRTRTTSARYVDSATGSDLYGDGTQANPYQTLGRAWRATSAKPSRIICRGRFSENMEDGNHGCSIEGDYFGAAVFDGLDSYIIYGFGHSNMHIINTGTLSYDANVHTGSGSLAGVGRASVASYVGSAAYVSGVAGSPVFIDRATLYWGVIGGTTAVTYTCFSRLKNNGIFKLSLGGEGYGSTVMAHNTIYGIPIEDRRKKVTANYPTYASSIFADFAIYADEAVNFDHCLFAADCKWYYNGTEIVISGATSEAREASLKTQMNALGIAEANQPSFVHCKFSTQTSEQIFNNPTKQDLTLNPEGDGVMDASHYYGALPPALNVPILNNSTGVANCWDENTATGILSVVDNTICLNEASTETRGEIITKAVKIDPSRYSLTAIFANFASKFSTYNTYLYNGTLTGDTYRAGTALPVGRYVVKGDIVYKEDNIRSNTILCITETGTSFTSDSSDAKVIELLDENISNVCYVRTVATTFVEIKRSEGLQRGGVYINNGNKNITYRGQTIVSGESFVAANDTDTFLASGSDTNYKVGILFDDTRVPDAEWIPAQMFGEYFVYKKNGAVMVDNDGTPISSGNYLSYQPQSLGGYSDVLVKGQINHKYVQFKIVAQKYDTTN